MLRLLLFNKWTELKTLSILASFKSSVAPTQRSPWGVCGRLLSSNSTNPLDPFCLIGENLNYLEQIEKDLRKSPNQLPGHWRTYLDSLSKLKPDLKPRRAISTSKQTKAAPAVSRQHDLDREPQGLAGPLANHLALMKVIKSVRRHGHLIAQIDPLGMKRVWSSQEEALKYLLPASANNIPSDLDNTYLLPKEYSFSGKEEKMKLGEIYSWLFAVYGGPVGYEFEHMSSLEKREWMMNVAQKREETLAGFSVELKKEALLKLSQAETFEKFLIKKYPTGKKFGLEGCEALIPGLHVFVNEALNNGAALFNFGMAHRGRLNVLVNVIEIELDRLFRGVRGSVFEAPFSGDVKYHWGSKRRFKRGKKRPYEICLLHNPSHLETVGPVVIGKTLADRRHIHELYSDRVWSVVMHGDAAMAGQGIVYEVFNMAKLPHFKCNGTLHIAVNNQIGFTANPNEGTSMLSCTDASKVIEAPVFHVNADDIENVLFVFKSAAEYRAQFKEDVIINLFGYRRPGHNEIDDPRFTQPVMYKVIEKHPTAYTKYKEKAISQKIISAKELQEFENAYIQKLEDAKSAEEKEKGKQNVKDWVDEVVDDNVLKPKKFDQNLLENALMQVERAICQVPESVKNINPKLKKLIGERAKYFKEGLVDWGMAEATFILYLLGMKVPVRFSGVDAMTCALFHRQLVVTDQETQESRNVIHEILDNEIPFDIANSPFSHYATLGFELGYSFCRRDIAVIWDAQFGDTLNMAQIIYDQYISSMEEKWGRSSGITLILPQGLEGEGSDLSTGRPERALSLVPDDLDKMGEVEGEPLGPLIASVTTPANYFHVMRQQYSGNKRKPLILFTLKRHTLLKGVQSSFAELKSEKGFNPYFPDDRLSNPHSPTVTKVLLCTGKVYYDIINERSRKNLNEKIAVGRVEQLYPLPRMSIFDDVMSYPNLKSICWVQEEPMNFGCWSHIKPRLDKMFNPLKLYLTYIGREPNPSAAPSSRKTFLEEHQRFLDRAMSIRE